MKASKQHARLRLVVGVVVVGVFAGGLTLYGDPGESNARSAQAFEDQVERRSGQTVEDQVEGRSSRAANDQAMGRSSRGAEYQVKGRSVTDFPHAPPVYGHRGEPVLRVASGGQELLPYVTGATDEPWGDIASATSGGPACSPSTAPVYYPLIVNQGDPSLDQDMVTTRLLIFRAGDLGESQAVRVTVVAMPEGLAWPEMSELYPSMWVGPPRKVTENAGKTSPYDPFVQGYPWLHTAELQCQPHYRDWHGACVTGFCIGGVGAGEQCDTLEDCYVPIVVTGAILNPVGVPGDILMPGATYQIQVISDDCPNLTDEDSYSPPLTIINEQWGDIVGTFGGSRYSLGEGVINVTTDATAVMNKFRNIEGAPIKARCDLVPEGFDLKITIADITAVINAFGGSPYPYDGPDEVDPCAPVIP